MLISWFKFAMCELTKSDLWLVSFLAVLTRLKLVEMKLIAVHGMKVQDRVHAKFILPLSQNKCQLCTKSPTLILGRREYSIFFSKFSVPLLLNIGRGCKGQMLLL